MTSLNSDGQCLTSMRFTDDQCLTSMRSTDSEETSNLAASNKPRQVAFQL